MTQGSDDAAPQWPIDDLSRAPWLRKAVGAAVETLAGGLWGFKVSGAENIPARGPLIIAGNHVSNFDGPLLAVAAGRARYMRGLSKVELFRVPLLGWVLNRCGAIPIDRRGDVKAMRSAVDVLRAGGCLGMFPEGTRAKSGVPGRPKPGLGFLAGVTGAAVVPARILNTDRWRRFETLEVRFGPSTRFVGDPADRARCLEFAQDVLDRVFTL